MRNDITSECDAWTQRRGKLGETHNTVSMVTLQTERRGKYATDQGNTVFEYPTHLLGLNRLIDLTEGQHFFPWQL